jgi:hypothetical protein
VSTLDELAAQLRAGGALLAAAAVDPAPGADTEVAELAGPEHALAAEAVHEGALLHYVGGRVLESDEDDLELLAGDHLFALGLDRLAAMGDLRAIAVLSDVIADCARAAAEGRPGDIAAVWRRGAASIGRAPEPSDQ